MSEIETVSLPRVTKAQLMIILAGLDELPGKLSRVLYDAIVGHVNAEISAPAAQEKAKEDLPISISEGPTRRDVFPDSFRNAEFMEPVGGGGGAEGAEGLKPLACTCDPKDRPPLCQRLYAASECQRAFRAIMDGKRSPPCDAKSMISPELSYYANGERRYA